MTLHVRPVSNEAEWEKAREIRHRVFVVEQQCPIEEEWDAFDETSRHLLGFAGSEAVAVSRWRTTSHGGHVLAKLERFAVLPEYRGRGYGREMVRLTIEDARRAGFTEYLLHAQAHLQRFYEELGFAVTDPEIFMEAGIAHVTMVRRDDAPGEIRQRSTLRSDGAGDEPGDGAGVGAPGL